MRASRLGILAAVLLFASSVPAQGVPACPGDCNGNGQVTPSDIGRINQLIVRCTPCADGRAGSLAAGCAGAPAGCLGADLNGDGCVRPSEWAYILKRLTSAVPPPGPCIDASGYPSR